MTNLKWLEECKKARDKYISDMETLISEGGSSWEMEKIKLEVRKVHALEIIAEELCILADRRLLYARFT